MKFVHCKSALTSNDLSKEVVGTLYELGFALKIFLRQDNDVNGSVCAIVNHLYSVILKLSEKSFYINWDNHRFNPAISASNKIRLWEVLKTKKVEKPWFFNFSTICSKHLRRIMEKYSQNKDLTKLLTFFVQDG